MIKRLSGLALCAMLISILISILFGCSGNPMKSLSILSVNINPTELPPEGGEVQIEVEATRGDKAWARVTRRGDFLEWLWSTSFTVKLTEVIALDLSKKRWKGKFYLPSNRTTKDQRYSIIVTVQEDYDQDQRLLEVVVKGKSE